MDITQFVENHYLLTRDLAPGSAEALRWTARAFLKWRRPLAATIEELDEPMLSTFIRDMQARGRAPRYLRRMRGDLLCFWRHAYRHGLKDRLPNLDLIRNPTVPRTAPEAWTRAEVRQLCKAADSFEGRYRWGIEKRAFWQAWIRVAWDTGLRPSDLLRLRTSQVSDGAIVVIQQKTQTAQVVALDPATLQAIRRSYPPQRELIFAWHGSKNFYYLEFARLVARAGLQGSPKRLRKSAASAVEVAAPGTASAFLGHLTPGLDRKHYLDPRIVQAVVRRPPSIG
jgi:integrase